MAMPVEELTRLRTMPAFKPPVHILNDYGHVDKDLVEISNKEQVEWINNGENEVQIFFDESPFREQRFHVAARGSTPSGSPTVAPGNKRYKYTVIGSQGNHDPAVIINP